MVNQRGEATQDDSDGGQLSGIDHTAAAPSLPGEIAWTERRQPAVLNDGAVIGDFEIVRRLGSGAAGTVYLARQCSLDRHVALKITQNLGSEARAMATLEHPHIVQVFSQTVDAADNQRLLCMQYVPGATLADVLAKLKRLPRAQLNGTALLNALDSLCSGQTPLNADALQDRQELATAGYVEAVCGMVARVAAALQFAHQRHVLHRDIKPANILIDPYGRPLLADFSLSLTRQNAGQTDAEVFGGTLPYMSPEQLDAFNPECAAKPETVDERSDIFSLGVVLYELLALAPPFAAPSARKLDGRALTLAAEARRSPPAPLHPQFSDIPYVLDAALARCLAADPAERYQDAGRLADNLEGCRLLCRATRQLPAMSRFMNVVAQFPLTALIVLSFLPHVLGSLFATAYNSFVLFPRLMPEQRAGLASTAAINCAVAFPLVASSVLILYQKTIHTWRRLAAIPPPTAAEVDDARRRLSRTPWAAAVFSLFGWAPPLLVISLSLRTIGAPMTWPELAHLAVSLLLGFLIATTYSFFVAQYVVVRIFYVTAWMDTTRFATAPREELAAAPRLLRWFQAGAGVIPVAGAILIVGAGPEAFAPGASVAFRWLAVSLMLLGMLGIWLSLEMGALILKSIDALVHPGRTTDARAASSDYPKS